MCGIVGYLGKRKAAPLLIGGLSKLEYRGYDSAGVAILTNTGIEVRKVKGRLFNLENDLNENPLEGSVGIGHTRWATHGVPSVGNSHPHLNKKGTIAVVHNGIIENYLELREWLGKEGYTFVSETDTEVIPHLVDYYYNGDLLEAVLKTVDRLKGSYALGVVSKDHPTKLIGVRKDSPLIVGLNEEKDEYFIASDIPAVLKETRKVYLLDDKEVVVLDTDGAKVFDLNGEAVNKEVFNVTWDADAAEKGGYDHFMLKEIMEQPKVISDTMKSRIALDHEIKLDTINITKEDITNYNRLYIVACGTAYHAGLVGKTLIERLAKIPVEVDIASEFRYREPLIDDKTLMIVVSQSGETADTLAALKLAKSKCARVIGVTNVVGSTVSRETTDVLYTWAGPEIAVASTKAYVSQLIAMYIIALFFAEKKETLDAAEINAIKEQLLALPEKVEEVLKCTKSVEKLAEEVAKHEYMFFLGRGLDYAVALEGSLKVKEISYIHSEAYGAGELKHGPIALIEDGTYVVALATQTNLVDKMISNIKEVKTRGANVIGVTLKGEELLEKAVDEVLYIPKVDNLVAPVLEVVPMQLLAYYTSIKKGCDVDKPRNLAKSVTVE
ncbi:glutamine--fructose-6-phosphate transaminase (isomerizing) [Clostridium cellulovorans]|uniref:Glutamine--fructose-6-phosphate aminotransferase [isomerizing] n=1 Tax=Clostridium cellulovorans (strain ATCC 35296 / DSM 3052 / OCM 3 / 743B) TaxID=573061 RepID=D9SWQ7_CLOC7|nr:glutamine--fructose-6-phosphate transaminase (isomerizing) [Clostridium cellulovorans]ADL53339.1 glucosamine/fructose-6-phosphate aminotransferase, isomerizing [Clostridium cellulovorans 743B]